MFAVKIFVVILAFALPAFSQTTQSNIESLSTAVLTGDIEQKRDALFAIRNIGSEEASRAAIPALKDRIPVVRATAVASVVFLSPAEAVTVLLPLLNDGDAFVRRDAILALGTVRHWSATDALLNSIRRDNDAEVKTAAVIALGDVGDAKAVDPLINILKNKPNEENEMHRRSAARSLGQIAFYSRAGRHYSVTPQNFLPEKFKEQVEADDEKATRLTAFRAALPVLAKILSNASEADDTRREAAFALGAIGDKTSAAVLQKYLNSPDPYLAEICKEALLMIKTS
ncbi:MAG: HEAT repeat domain-containing protein [Acidobacteria bacterium]|nr:HEAT repeat domain-containing protein [Acidobacteriota bacterium]